MQLRVLLHWLELGIDVYQARLKLFMAWEHANVKYSMWAKFAVTAENNTSTVSTTVITSAALVFYLLLAPY